MIDRPAFDHIGHRGAVGRVVHEVVVGLVDQDRHRLRDALDHLLDVGGADDHAGRIIRVAQVEQPHRRGVLVGLADHRVEVLLVILQQRHLDALGLDVGGVLVDRGIGRIGADHLLAAEQERLADDLEDLAGTRGQQDVLGLDAVVRGDLLDDVAIRVAVAVGVLPGVVHRLHHVLGRAEVVLVAGQLGKGVVLGLAAPELRRAALGEQIASGAQAQGAHGSGDASEEPTARKRVPDVHESSNDRRRI